MLQNAAVRAHKTVGLSLLLLYGSFLQPAEFAVLALLYLTTTLVETIATQGLTAQVLLQAGLQREGPEQRRMVSTAFIQSVSVAALLFGTLALCARPLQELLFSPPQSANLFPLMALAGFLRAVQNMPRQMLRIRNRQRGYALLRLAEALITACLSILFLAVAGMGLKGVVYGEVLRELLVTALLVLTLRRDLTPAYSAQRGRILLRLGLPRLWREFPTVLLATNDRYVLAIFVSLPLLGIYAFALRIAQGLIDLAVQPLLSLVPGLQREAAAGEAEPRLVLGRFVTYCVALSGLLALAMAVFAEPLLRLLTQRFAMAAQVLPLLLLAVLLSGMQRLVLSIMAREGRIPQSWRLLSTGAAVLSLVGNVLLVPSLGIWGAASTMVLVQAFLCAAAFAFQRRSLGLPLEAGRLVKVTAAMGITYYVSRFVTPEPLLGQLAAAAAMVFLYPALLGVLGFYTVAEVDRMRNLLNRRVAILPEKSGLRAEASKGAEPSARLPELVGVGAESHVSEPTR